ncbi:MAG: divalent-cation tolerance protein CutA [Acidimicrobiales bacterium]|jgi:periplasmic divalent cation tolerance protein
MSQVQIQFAIDDPDRADAIIEHLLSERLVACGQRLGPMVSRYWWDGSLARSDEWLVLLKTRSTLRSRVIESVVGSHPYAVPEVVAVEIVDGAHDYLDWITEVTTGTGP